MGWWDAPRAERGAIVVAGMLASSCVGLPPPPPSSSGGADGTSTMDATDSLEPSATGAVPDGTSASESTGPPEPACGNGILEEDELCDDGNLDDGDGCSADCLEADCLVPITHPTIQAGVDDPECSTVWILAGTYAEHVTIERDVVLSETDSGAVVVDAETRGRPITVTMATVTLDGLRLIRGRAADGGGLYGLDAELILDGTEITGNVASGTGVARGGGIFVEGGSLTLLGARVLANVADDARASGGGLYVGGTTVELLAGSEVGGNRALQVGAGGISSEVGLASGGGIEATDASLVVADGSRVVGNVVRAEVSGVEYGQARGGGLSLFNSLLEVGEGGRVEANRVEVVGDAPDGLYGQGGGLNVSLSQVIFAGASLRDNVVLVEGLSEDVTAAGGGIGVSSNSTIVMDSTVVAGNRAQADAAAGEGEFDSAGARGGAVYGRVGTSTDTVTVRLDGCTVEGNRAVATGVGEAVSSSASGGAAYLGAGTGDAVIEMDVVRSVVRDNSAEARGAQGGGVYVSSSTGQAVARIASTESTFSGNRAAGTASASGGALYLSTGTGEAQTWGIAVNSTFSGNSASTSDASGSPVGGAVYVRDGISLAFTNVRLYSSTLTENTAGQGGAVYVVGDQQHVELLHSIVEGNTAAVDSDLGCTEQSVDSDGFNLVGDPGSCPLDNGNDVVGRSALLMPLADNGGPTPTHALTPGSPAHDGGDPVSCSDPDGVPLSVDQRGEPRLAGPDCDIGAFELQP